MKERVVRGGGKRAHARDVRARRDQQVAVVVGERVEHHRRVRRRGEDQLLRIVLATAGRLDTKDTAARGLRLPKNVGRAPGRPQIPHGTPPLRRYSDASDLLFSLFFLGVSAASFSRMTSPSVAVGTPPEKPCASASSSARVAPRNERPIFRSAVSTPMISALRV